MRLLIDSHVLIWWWAEQNHLSASVSKLLIDPATTIFVSAATAWEIGTKHRLGKLPQLDGRFRDVSAEFANELAVDRFTTLAVTLDHGLRAGMYEMAHRDPFDRLLAAQAELENITLVTRDPAFAAFPCDTLW